MNWIKLGWWYLPAIPDAVAAGAEEFRHVYKGNLESADDSLGGGIGQQKVLHRLPGQLPPSVVPTGVYRHASPHSVQRPMKALCKNVNIAEYIWWVWTRFLQSWGSGALQQSVLWPPWGHLSPKICESMPEGATFVPYDLSILTIFTSSVSGGDGWISWRTLFVAT
jgi:hypothetical protein